MQIYESNAIVIIYHHYGNNNNDTHVRTYIHAYMQVQEESLLLNMSECVYNASKINNN